MDKDECLFELIYLYGSACRTYAHCDDGLRIILRPTCFPFANSNRDRNIMSSQSSHFSYVSLSTDYSGNNLILSSAVLAVIWAPECPGIKITERRCLP
jgi:hypothetical protein